jgi:protein SCO1/2
LKRTIAQFAIAFVGFLPAVLSAAPPTAGSIDPTKPGTENRLPHAVEKVALEQKVGARIPPDLVFVDDDGQRKRLVDVTGGAKPGLLALVYYECPSLCGLVMGSVYRALKEAKLATGKDYTVTFVSIDPKETPALAKAKKDTYLRRYGYADVASGFHFMTGDEASIQRLADLVGFRYAYDRETKQYAHPGAVIVTTPDGRLSRYIAGVEFPGRDVRLALVEASKNTIGSPVDHFFLYCYKYDPTTGKYGLVVMRALRILGIFALIAIGGFVWVLSAISRQRTRQTSVLT